MALGTNPSAAMFDRDLTVLIEDGERTVYRGWREAGVAQPLLAVVPKAQQPGRAILDRMEHEYALANDLDIAWALRPRALLREGVRPVLLLDDPGGEPLEPLLGAPMELGQFLRVAIGAAAALGKVHQRGLVHREIKPANILVNGGGEAVRLTGFGIASRLPRERRSPEPPESIAGTLAYMAPEQTGRMNRSIDSRSDLYSLGVTLYQALTGSLPFSATDPMEWFHCHIARSAPPPGEWVPELPPIVSAIVLKLLAKNAEERYQTAAGLESDLRRCLSQWEAQQRIDEFALGEHDTPDRLLIHEKLYGREREVEALLAAFDRVVKSGEPELVLVSGYSGIGKSSVVNELHRVLVPPRGLFAAGKFDQYKRDIPYSTLAQAFRNLVRGLLAKSDADLQPWRDALRDALGASGRLIFDVVPELELIIGHQPPVPPLDERLAKARFQLVLRRFIGVFARPEHPLALFLDDLQWADAATLDLLEDLLSSSDLRHLMLIGAYRDNEVDSTHPLARRLEAIKKAGGEVKEITLEPLAHEHLGHLISDVLRCKRDRATPLAQLVHEKTAGNPFFVIQFLYALVEEGLLAFVHDRAQWSWDLDRLHAKAYTENVVDLMVGKLNRLPAETQEALRQLACLGNVAELSIASVVLGIPEGEVHADLWEAVRLGTIERQARAYRFVHDKVQEAAYSLTPEGQRAAAHLRIGRLLAAHTAPEKREEAIFDIVNQLNRGVALITSRDEREQLSELNLLAGKRAKGAAAYSSALVYFNAGAALLPDDAWERRHELGFAMELNRAECEFLTGVLVPSETRLANLIGRAATLPELAAVTRPRLDLLMALGRRDRAIEAGLEYLRRSGPAWSAQPTLEDVREEYERMWRQIGDRPIEALLDLPRMTDPIACGTMDVLTALVAPAWHTDPNLRSLVIGRTVNLSLEHGNSDASCYAYTVLSTVLGPYFGDYKAGFRFGQLGLDLVEQCGLDRFKARVYVSVGSLVDPWTRHIRTCRQLLWQAFEAAGQDGDLTFAAFSCTHLLTNLLASGDSLGEAQREAEAGVNFCRQARFGQVVDRITGQLQLIRVLRGLTSKFGCFDEAGFDEQRFERYLQETPHLALAACWYWIRKMQARFFAGDCASAVAAAANAKRLLWTSPAVFELAEYEFYAALALAALSDVAPAAERAQHLEALAAHHRQIQEWADNCPENFENRAALVGAEMGRIEGRELDAERLYEQAIRSARANGFVHNEALAHELAARFYLARGFEDFAHVYLRKARDGYLRWGADGKARQLGLLYPHLREEERGSSPTGFTGDPVEHLLDLQTVIKVSQAVSGEMILEKLIDTLMRTALEQAGAERGLLILPRGAEQRIAAAATTVPGAVAVEMRDEAVAAATLPASVLHYVLRTRENVVLDEAASRSEFAADPYIRGHQTRSVLCLPLLNQAKLIGVLYLENNLAPRVFAQTRIAVLRLLASQAAISLENARLYRDLAEREAKIRRLVDANIIGIFTWQLKGENPEESLAVFVDVNDAFLRIVGYDREDLVTGSVDQRIITPPDWQDRTQRAMAEMKTTGFFQPYEKEYFRKDGTRVPVLVGAATFEEGGSQGVAFVLDLTERKRAEAALRERDATLRGLVDANIIGTFTWRLDKAGGTGFRPVFQDVNDAFLRIVGYNREDLSTTTSTWILTPPDWVDRTQRAAEEMKRNGAFQPYEKEFLRKDGSRVPVVVGAAQTGDTGIAFVLDLTEQKRAEAAATRGEKELREIVDTIPAMTVTITADGRDAFIGRRFSEYSGLSEEEARGSGWRVTVHPDDLDLYLRIWRASLASGEPAEFETRVRRADGEYRWFLARAVAQKDDRGNILKWYEVLTDIEDRKRAELALGRSEAYLAEAQKLTHTGSSAIDPANGKSTYWSEEMFRIHGIEPSLGIPGVEEYISRFVHPEDRAGVREAFERASRDKDEYAQDYRIVLPGGTVKHLHAIGHPVLGKTGEPIEYFGTMADVTERKRAAAEQANLEERLRKAENMEAIGRFASGIAHDFNSVLAGILAFGEMLFDEAPENTARKRHAQNVLSAATRGRELVEQILSYSRSQHGEREPIDACRIVAETLELLRATLPASVTLTASIPDAPIVVIGHATQLHQVVMNLGNNSVQAMSAGGSLHVAVSSVDLSTQQPLSHGSLRPARYACLRVEDSGSGMDEATLARIFEPFFTTKEAGRGTGLGLALVYAIAADFGGAIDVQSTPAQGSTFSIYLPLANLSASPGAA